MPSTRASNASPYNETHVESEREPSIKIKWIILETLLDDWQFLLCEEEQLEMELAK